MSEGPQQFTYAASGVDIDAGERAVTLMRTAVERTSRPEVVGGLGGLFTVFLFGTVYYGSAMEGAELLLLQEGLYAGDWSVFGAFVAAPVGSFLWGFGALGLRLAFQWFMAKRQGRRFDALDRPLVAARRGDWDDDETAPVGAGQDHVAINTKITGKFF